MQIRHEQLASQLKKSLAPIYFIHGDVPLFMQECVDAIRQATEKEYSERHILYVDAHFAWTQLLDVANSLSLFSSMQLIELRMGTHQFTDIAKKTLSAYCERIPSDKILLITAEKLEYQQQKATWYQTLLKLGVTIQLWPLERNALPAWIKERLTKYQLTTDANGMEILAERSEGNLLALSQAIEKLYLLYGPGFINEEQIACAVTNHTHFEIFDLSQAVLLGNGARICQILAELKNQGSEPILVLWLLTKEIRTLFTLAQALASGLSVEQTLTKVYIKEKQKAFFRSALQKHNLSSLLLLIKHAHALDCIVKGLEKGQIWDELERFALKIGRITLG